MKEIGLINKNSKYWHFTTLVDLTKEKKLINSFILVLKYVIHN